MIGSIKKHCCTLLIFAIAICNGWANSIHKILIINSYHNTLSWTDSLDKGFINSLKSNEFKLEIFVENLDSKRISTISYNEQFSQFIIAKYSKINIELILVTDNDALDYIEQLQKNYFINIPVIFCGVNNRYDFPQNYTGIIEEVDIHKNLNLIAKFHPKLKNLYCIVDQTTTGKILEKSIKEEIEREKYHFTINVLTNLPIEELISKVKTLGENNAILFILFNQDSNGKYFSYEAALDSISIHSKVPIYGTWGFYLGHGIIGGNIISGYEHGKQAGELALKVLKGTPINELKPVVGCSKNVFDFKYMSNNKIGLSQIPKGSIVLNNPFLFFHKNKAVIILTLVTFIVLIIIIYLLLVLNQNKKKLLDINKTYNQELKEKNQQINESLSKAEEANRLKSAFLANMSHEIRTPMNAIIGFSRLIQIRKNLKKEDFDNFLNIIAENAQKLLNLINDIIDISKIEVNQLKFNIGEANINSILKSCFNNAEIERLRLEKTEVNLNLTFSASYNDLIIKTDPDRIYQVIMNLLNNALKFTEKGSISLGYEIVNEWVEIYVKDTGVGINQQDLSVIFDRFRQVDTELTRRYGGSGLGLSICKGIINGLGGEMGVKSEMGVGSTFWFRVPYISTTDPIAEKKVNEVFKIKSLENKTILIVEDNFVSSKLLTEMLKHTKANLILSTNAEEAIEICKHNANINLVLMDIQLPGINGYEATRIIKSIRPTLPIIAQTANAMSNEKEKAILMGCDEYITKPYDLEQLLNSIEKLVN